MDLNQLQAALTQLAVTFRSESDPANLQAALPGERLYRASIYLPRLQAVRTFLTVTLPPLLAPNAAFVQPALQSTEIFNDLALQMDFWVGPAVQIELDNANAATMADYQNYFTGTILDINPVNYALNLTNFFARFPILDHLLTQLVANFQANIQLACTRIIADQNRIQNLFIDRYPGLTLLSLTKISSTGSDFHKGGQQVLILTFWTRWWWGVGQYTPWWSDLKVVYKPADVEVDCLLVGDSAAVNRAVGGLVPFMNINSLVEIFNIEATNNPLANLEQLPTYRILPMNPTSPLPPPAPGMPLPIRNAYGYIEHLGYSWTGIPLPIWNLYLTGESDYIIYRNTDETPIIRKFYRQLGHLLAIATIFSIGDLHGENVRVTDYQPHLIDLEAALTEVFNNDVTATGLFESILGTIVGGINGQENAAEDWVWSVTTGANVDLNISYITKKFENRLWALRSTKKIVPVNVYFLLQGLRSGMVTLRGCQPSFAAWFGRLNHVLVRILPYGTQVWRVVRREVYTSALSQPGPLQADAAVQLVLQQKLDIEFAAFNPAAGLPEFVVMQPGTIPAPAAAAVDVLNFDIPSFYHRIGTNDLLDSRGNVIPVPPTVTVTDPLAPPATHVVNTNAVVPTYFAAPPTTNVRNNQANPVGNLALNAFLNLIGDMEQATSVAMGLAHPPPDMGELIP